ncbi:MAG: alpha/beta fold hydrolase [Ignavibacteria bacterium]|nr:alpha/beta fold hydrolase [Ignavibacteria bacterium]
MNIIKNKLDIFPKGDTANQPVIFIHGFPFDHNMWNNQIDELSSNYFCVSYDIRGLGQSPVADGQYTMEMFTDDVLDIIEKQKLYKPVLCGLSMGGYIAQRAVERNENLFSALILCDTKSAADNNDAKIKRAEGIKKINELGVKRFVEEFISNCFAEESISKLGEVYKETLNRSLNFSAEGIKGCLLAMAGRTDTTEFLSEIKIPVLLICGEKDKLTPRHIMEEMANSITDSEFHTIPNVGHITPLENPNTVNKIIKDFLSRKVKLKS